MRLPHLDLYFATHGRTSILIITTNKGYKNWPESFNHHAETVVIEGKIFRRKGQIESRSENHGHAVCLIEAGGLPDAKSHRCYCEMAQRWFSNRPFLVMFTPPLAQDASVVPVGGGVGPLTWFEEYLFSD